MTATESNIIASVADKSKKQKDIADIYAALIIEDPNANATFDATKSINEKQLKIEMFTQQLRDYSEKI